MARGEVLDSIQEYGNAAAGNAMSDNGTVRGFTNSAVGNYTLTAGGTDFWDVSDHGSFIYDADLPQAGNFSAVVRSVSVAAGETVAGEWGRTGLMARKNPLAGNSANVAHIRKSGGDPAGTNPADSLMQGRPTDGAGTDRGPNENGEFRNFTANTANGSVQNTPIWLSLHRFNGQYYGAWAPDAGGMPGTWSTAIQRVGTADMQGPVYVGLAHQSHNIHPVVNTAVFSNFAVQGFDGSFGAFPLTYTCNLAFSGNDLFLTASGTELGASTPQNVNWEVRYYGADGVNPGGITADLYLQGNAGNRAAFETMIAGPPNGTTRIQRIDWAADAYTTTNPGGVNLFAAAVPGSFGGNQENYGVHLRGEIFIPSDVSRNGVETVLFHDGVDDYCLLEVDGVELINDNNWTGRSGVDNGGGQQGAFDCSDPKFNDGEWVRFKMGTWEGGGGDDAFLAWNALDRTGSDNVTGATDGTLNSYLGTGGSGQLSFANHASDAIPAANFRTVSPSVIGMQSGTGQPANFLLNPTPAGTRYIEVWLDGKLCRTVPLIPSINSADFTSHSIATINLIDVGGGGTSDVNPTTVTVLRDGVAITPSIMKTGLITAIVDTFMPEPPPLTSYKYDISGRTTVATGNVPFSLSVTLRSYAIRSVLRAGLSAPPNATVGWSYMEFSVAAALGRDLGGGVNMYLDAQNVVRDGTPAFTATEPFINHTDPETNANSGDWIPDRTILSNTGADDNQYVTFARTMVTIPMGGAGRYTVRIRGDDGYGLRISGATAISVAGNATNQIDRRNSSAFYPDGTGDSNAFIVYDFPTAGDYLVEFFAFEGGGGSYQEISWAKGSFTGIAQSSTWALLGNATGYVSQSRWGVIPESVIPSVPTVAPGGWGTHIWYGATNAAAQQVDNLGQTMAYLRDVGTMTATSTSNIQMDLPYLNHRDDVQGNSGPFQPDDVYPGDIAGDTDRIAMIAHARIVSPADGLYTIQVRSDDGFLLRFDDPADKFVSISGGGELHPSAANEVFFAAGTGDSDTRATTFLTKGDHDVVFVWWEGGGGSFFEISSAPGTVPNHGPEYALLTTTPIAPNLWLGLKQPKAIRITNFVYNQGAQTFDLTWTSEPGRLYGIFWSQSLVAPTFNGDINDSILSQGASTTSTGNPHPFTPGPYPSQLFLRVEDRGPITP